MTRGLPVFLDAQAECRACGRPLPDALVVEMWGAYCSARCHHRGDLPRVGRHGA